MGSFSNSAVTLRDRDVRVAGHPERALRRGGRLADHGVVRGAQRLDELGAIGRLASREAPSSSTLERQLSERWSDASVAARFRRRRMPSRRDAAGAAAGGARGRDRAPERRRGSRTARVRRSGDARTARTCGFLRRTRERRNHAAVSACAALATRAAFVVEARGDASRALRPCGRAPEITREPEAVSRPAPAPPPRRACGAAARDSGRGERDHERLLQVQAVLGLLDHDALRPVDHLVR